MIDICCEKAAYLDMKFIALKSNTTTENAGVKNAIRAKLQGWKIARVEMQE